MKPMNKGGGRSPLGLALSELMLSLTEGGNRFIYAIKRLPILGKKLGNTLYAATPLKIILGIGYRLMKGFAMLILYWMFLAMFTVLPVVIFVESMPEDWSFAPISLTIFCAFYVFNVFASNAFMRLDEEDFLSVTVMGVSPRVHYGILLAKRLLMRPIRFFPILLIFGFKAYAVLNIVSMGYILISEALSVYTFKAKGGAGISWFFYPIYLAVVAWCLHLAVVREIYVVDLLVTWPAALIFLLVGALGAYLLVRYRGYRALCREHLTLEAVSETGHAKNDANKNAAGAGVVSKFDKGSDGGKYDKLQGYAYLNALFFERHRSVIRKPFLIKMYAVNIGGVLMLAVLWAVKQFGIHETPVTELYGGLEEMLGLLVFLLYCISVGRWIVPSLFFNCDRFLLAYGYYRKSGAILKNFMIRLKYILKLELCTGVCLGFWLTLPAFVFGAFESMVSALLIGLTSVALSVFFSVFFLCIYYIFQPYTDDMKQVSVGYKLANTAVYFFAYVMFYADLPFLAVAISSVAVSVIVIPLSFLLVYKLAPKSFCRR